MFKVSRFIYSFAILLFMPFLHQAQTVEWSNQSKVKSKTNYSQILGENANGVFLVRCRTNDFRHDIVVERYKSNLALELSYDLPLPANNILEKLVLLENEILLFTSGKNYTTGKIELSCVRLDISFKQTSSPVILCEVEAGLFKDNSNFYIKTSGDKTKFALMYIVASADKNSSKILYQGFNDQLVTTYKKETQTDFAVEDVFFSSMECNNEGDLFSIVDFPKNIRKNRESDPRDFFLFACQQSMDKIAKYKLGNDSVYINELGLAINNYNKTVCITGFYSHKPDNSVDGEFFYLIDALTSIAKTMTFSPFSKSYLAKIAGNMQNENGVGLSDIYIRKIISRSDGGCLTVAEKYYETKQAYTFYVNGFPQTNYRTVYNYDEIILVSKNSDGSTQFNDFIKKSQSSVSDAGYYSSFITTTAGDKIGIVYNSDTNNEGDVMISTVSNKGATDTKVLVKALSYFVLLMPGESKQVSANSTIICTLKDKRFSIMRLTF